MMRNNTLYLFFFLIIINVLQGCAKLKINNEVFNWSVTDSAPEGYIMEIAQGKLYIKGTDTSFSLPNDVPIEDGWGKGISNRSAINAKLPDRLSIIFYSYLEKQFYRGDFDLPYDRMVALFQEAVDAFDATKSSLAYYSKIMVGIAPGGTVAVWVTGARTKEVFFGQAKKIELNPSLGLDFPFDSTQEYDEYVEEIVAATLGTERLNEIRQKGIPFELWSRYRNQYPWTMSLLHGDLARKINLIHINGEHLSNAKINFNHDGLHSYPIPRYLSFQVKTVRSEYIEVYEVNFDDIEILEAFEQLASHVELSEPDRVIRLEFDLKEDQTTSTVRLFNAAQSITLKKAVFTE